MPSGMLGRRVHSLVAGSKLHSMRLGSQPGKMPSPPSTYILPPCAMPYTSSSPCGMGLSDVHLPCAKTGPAVSRLTATVRAACIAVRIVLPPCRVEPQCSCRRATRVKHPDTSSPTAPPATLEPLVAYILPIDLADRLRDTMRDQPHGPPPTFPAD